MYSSIIFIQYLSIVVLFIEAWVVFRKWNSRLHSYLFFGIVANIVNNIGYLLEGHKGQTITIKIKMEKEDE